MSFRFWCRIRLAPRGPDPDREMAAPLQHCQTAQRSGAIKVLTLANRRRKDRPDELMRQIRYDRAILYEKIGRRAQARRELERLYSEDPEFEDLRERLFENSEEDA